MLAVVSWMNYPILYWRDIVCHFLPNETHEVPAEPYRPCNYRGRDSGTHCWATSTAPLRKHSTITYFLHRDSLMIHLCLSSSIIHRLDAYTVPTSDIEQKADDSGHVDDATNAVAALTSDFVNVQDLCVDAMRYGLHACRGSPR